MIEAGYMRFISLVILKDALCGIFEICYVRLTSVHVLHCLCK